MKWSCFSFHFSPSLTKKLHHCYNQQMCIHIYNFFLILSISVSPIYFFSKFFFLSPILREWLCLCVWLRSHPLQKQKLIFTIFFLVSHLLLVLLLSVLLVFFFFIIYFYIIDITDKYNKLLLIWQKYMISYLIIFVFSFDGFCFTNLITFLDYCII